MAKNAPMCRQATTVSKIRIAAWIESPTVTPAGALGQTGWSVIERNRARSMLQYQEPTARPAIGTAQAASRRSLAARSAVPSSGAVRASPPSPRRTQCQAWFSIACTSSQ